MSYDISRRAAIKGGAALAGMAALGIPAWISPAFAQSEEVVPWADVPDGFNPAAGAGPHSLDTRTIQKSSFITPTDDFFAVQHYGPTQVDPASYKLRLSGLVDKPMELTLEELKRRPRTELVAGFECSGNNSTRLNTLVGNARWAGTSVAALLKDAGSNPPQGKWSSSARTTERKRSLTAAANRKSTSRILREALRWTTPGIRTCFWYGR